MRTRVENAGLRVLEGRCPNLLSEAGLYRYSDAPHERHTAAPLDDHNHSLAALRYLIARLDAGRRQRARDDGTTQPSGVRRRPWLRLDNEALWTPFRTG